MRRQLLAFVAMTALLVSVAAPADAGGEDAWAGLEVMDDSEMSDMRGGLRVAPGLDVEFGAVITTYANDDPVLQTHLTWTDTGAMVDQTYGSLGTPIESLPSSALAILGIEGMQGAGGVVILDSDGVTALMHNVTNGALQNIIINNANGRDLRQEIDVTLALPNFEAVQERYSLQRLGLILNEGL